MNNNEEFFAELLQVQPVPPNFIQAIEAINNNGFGYARACCYLYIYDSDLDWLYSQNSDGYINIEAPGGDYYVRWKLCRFQGQLYFIFIFPLNDFSARETSMNEVLNLVANESGRVIDNNGIYHRLQSIRPDIVIPPPDQPNDSLIPFFGNESNEGLIEPLPNQLVGSFSTDTHPNNDEGFVTPSPNQLAGGFSADTHNNEEDFVTPPPNQLAGVNHPNNDEDFVTPSPNHLAGVSVLLFGNESDDESDEEGFLTPPRNQLAADLIAESDDEESDDEESADHESDESYHEDEDEDEGDEDDEDESDENYDEDDVEVVQEAEQNVVSCKRKRKQTRFYKPDKRSTSSHR